MRDYHQLHLARSACVHFVDADGINEGIEKTFEQVFFNAIDCAYVDYKQCDRTVFNFVNAIALALNLEHAPYSENPWLQWLDDMITRSFRSNGAVIIIENADLLLSLHRDWMFDLIEAFLTQFHHWLEKERPCHLCFQMSTNQALRTFCSSHEPRRS